ncbi:hypothetical protein HMPREF9628_02214 [Peptoanaerobacter stomatis]|jgi:HTH domain|uniref:Helix-turn-helix type 11 domain-containing protein n=1 Tax=Peptoanaerobacter stomatis TaxID=796937 RepID=G9XF61_9FIRM|nr:HTH domain-containing protein [Peptoanaerobacter stomatis]EHL17555.1 hypothetical protein HMPREF9628_02214 [Peptoanaerobacter stomatis]
MRRKLNREHIEQYIIENSYKTVSTLAKELEISRTTVYKYAKELSLDLSPKKRKEYIEEATEQYIKDNWDASVTEIADRFNICRQTLSKKVPKFKRFLIRESEISRYKLIYWYSKKTNEQKLT